METLILCTDSPETSVDLLMSQTFYPNGGEVFPCKVFPFKYDKPPTLTAIPLKKKRQLSLYFGDMIINGEARMPVGRGKICFISESWIDFVMLNDSLTF